MKNKKKWYSTLVIWLVLLLASSIIGCSGDAYQEGFQAGYEKGYEAGHEKGRQAGYNEGHNAGYSKGYTEGLNECVSDSTPPISTPSPEEAEPKLPDGASWWYEAKDHIGDRLTICGPVKDTAYSSSSGGQPTFINLGEPYPSPDRFIVIIWGNNRINFPEPPESYYKDKDICVTGLIVEYEGMPEIEVTSPDQIQIQ